MMQNDQVDFASLIVFRGMQWENPHASAVNRLFKVRDRVADTSDVVS